MLAEARTLLSSRCMGRARSIPISPLAGTKFLQETGPCVWTHRRTDSQIEVVVGLPSGSAHRFLSGAAALGTTGLFSRRPQWGGPGSSAGTSHSHDSRSSLAELARGRARLDALNVQPTVSLFSSSLPNSMTSMCCKVMEIMSLPWSENKKKYMFVHIYI